MFWWMCSTKALLSVTAPTLQGGRQSRSNRHKPARTQFRWSPGRRSWSQNTSDPGTDLQSAVPACLQRSRGQVLTTAAASYLSTPATSPVTRPYHCSPGRTRRRTRQRVCPIGLPSLRGTNRRKEDCRRGTRGLSAQQLAVLDAASQRGYRGQRRPEGNHLWSHTPRGGRSPTMGKGRQLLPAFHCGAKLGGRTAHDAVQPPAAAPVPVRVAPGRSSRRHRDAMACLMGRAATTPASASPPAASGRDTAAKVAIRASTQSGPPPQLCDNGPLSPKRSVCTGVWALRPLGHRFRFEKHLPR